MAQPMERTCWRGMRVEHPADWELAVACGIDEPGRCTFVDRHYQRLDLRWRPLKYVPELELILDKYRLSKDDRPKLTELAGAPPPWRGLTRKADEGVVVHAARFFADVRRLAEVTLVWPGRRDTELERAILESVACEDPSAGVRQWQAMGMSLSVGREYDLYRSRAKVGRVSWEFATRGRRPAELMVERIAMASYWLTKPLREWLIEELPAEHRAGRQDMVAWGAHRAERVASHGRLGAVAALRGLRRVRVDLAWRCGTEDRVYRVGFSRIGREDEVELPDHLEILCCRAAPAVAAWRAGG